MKTEISKSREGLIAGLFIYIVSVSLSGCSREPDRLQGYISLAPSVTEILYEIGADDLLTARTDYCNWPPASSEKPSVGSFSFPSVERIVSYRPSLVFAADPPQGDIIRRLRGLGFRVESFNPGSLNELFSDIYRIGSLTGRRASAAETVKQLELDIAGAAITPPEIPVSVYVEISDNPMMSAGGKSYISDIIALAGGTNIAEGIGRDYFITGYEFIIEKNPDIIILFMVEKGRRQILMRRLSGKVSAVSSGRVFEITDSDIFVRPGPRVAEAVRRLAEIFHTDSKR